MAGVQKARGRDNSISMSPDSLLRTCQNCFTAKIRCDRGEETGPCLRCKRLSKTCHFPPARRRLNNPQRDSRINALEARLEELMGTTPSPACPSSPSNLPHDRRGTSAHAIAPAPPDSTPASSTTASDSRSTGRTLTPSEKLNDPFEMQLLSRETAEVLLQRFKTSMTPHFPFVVVPSHTSVEVLQRDKPFLLLAILAAAAYDDIPLQRRLGHEMKCAINTKMIYVEAMSIEMLQALMIHLAWSQYHSRPRRYSQYLQLAISIAIDLRLDRNPNVRPWKTRLDVRTEAADSKGLHSLDEQRAVAGCYYLSCSISKLLQKHCTFPWSLHIEECCKFLYQQRQYPSDRYIPYIVQLQHIIEDADAGAHYSTNLGLANQASVPRAAEGIDVTHCRSQIESFKNDLPFPLIESHFLKMQFHTVELYLCLVGVSTNPTSNTLPNEEQWPQWRLETLSMGMVAAKSLLDFYLSQPLRSEMNFNNTEWIQISFGLTLAARLTVLTNQRSIQQETMYLRCFLDMPDILKGFINRLRSLITDQVDDTGERDTFVQTEHRIKRLQAWFEGQSANLQDRPAHALNDKARASIMNPGNAIVTSSPDFLTGGISSMSSTLLPLECSSIWMNDSLLPDGMMDFSSMAGFNPDLQGSAAPFWDFMSYGTEGSS